MLFGPLTLVLDSSPENQLWGVAFLVLCVAAFFVAVARPRPWSIGLAAVAVVVWLVVGWFGAGINC